MVTDGLHFATADVIINVADVNDNAPTFNRETYSIDMADGLDVIDADQVLLTLFADDPDAGQNGMVTYWISGEISVLRNTQLELKLYLFILSCVHCSFFNYKIDLSINNS